MTAAASACSWSRTRLTVREHLCDVLAADRELEVVGEAADGKQAIELCQRCGPTSSRWT